MISIHIQMAKYGDPHHKAFYEYTQQLVREGISTNIISADQHISKLTHNEEGLLSKYTIPVDSYGKLSIEPILFAIEAIKIIKKIKIENPQKKIVVHTYTSWEMALIGLYLKFSKSKKILSIFDIRSGAISDGLIFKIGMLIQRLLSKVYDKTIVISGKLGEDLGIKNYLVLPIGVDIEKFRFKEEKRKSIRKSLGVPETSKVVVYSGLIRDTKGAKEVFDIAKKCCEKNKDVSFLILGDGPDFEKYRKDVEAFKHRDRIYLTGRVSPDVVPDYLSAADVGLGYVPVNRLYNPQPSLKVAEYLSCGLPVIATNTDGNKIYLSHEKNGILAEDDIHEISDQILFLLEDDERFNSLKKNARSSIISFSWENIVKGKLIGIYKNCDVN